MQTQQPPKVEPTPTPKRRGWLVAAIAFVAVLVVGIAVMLSNQQSSEPPRAPAPEPTTTTAAPADVDDTPSEESAPAPSTTVAEAPADPTEADLAYASSLASAYNDEDIEAYLALLGTEVAFTDVDGFTVDLDFVRVTTELWWQLDQRLTLDTCRLTSTGRVACRYTVTDVLSEAVGFPAPWVTVTFVQNDGVAIDYRELWSMDTHVAYDELLRDWFDENLPGEARPFDLGFRDQGRYGHLHAEDPALILEHLDEFVASLNG
jgi:hypothetical protein